PCSFLLRRPARPTLFPYTTLFRSGNIVPRHVTELFDSVQAGNLDRAWEIYDQILPLCNWLEGAGKPVQTVKHMMDLQGLAGGASDRKSTRLNSSHVSISYAVFCLK